MRPASPDHSPCSQPPGSACGARSAAVLLAAALALAACEAPPYAQFEPSPGVLDGPPPELIPTDRFEVVSDAADEGTLVRIQSESEDLSRRADGLQQRAEGLSGPVIDSESRTRLEGGVTFPAEEPASP